MKYYELKCGECDTIITETLAVDRMIAMCQHFKKAHKYDLPRFDMEAWDTQTVHSEYTRRHVGGN